MFYSTTTNTYIQEGTPFEINDVQYPANWLNLASPEQKSELGLEEVIATNSREDDRFYFVSEELNGASLTYVNTPKELEGLKTMCISQINQQAYSLLSPTDYMTIKALETGIAMPADWKAWREQIRQQALTAKTAINASTDIPSLITASTVEWAKNPTEVVVNV